MINGSLPPWETVAGMSGPELTTNYVYWGLHRGHGREKNQAYTRLLLEEQTWLVRLPKAQIKEALDHLALNGWPSIARTAALISGLHGYEPPHTVPVVRSSSEAGLPAMELQAAASADELAESLAGMTIAPIAEGIVPPESNACHVEAAESLLGELIEGAVKSKRNLTNVYCFFGVNVLVGFGINRRGKLDWERDNAIEMLAGVAAAGGSVAALEVKATGCPFHGRNGKLYAFAGKEGELATLSSQDKIAIWNRMDKAFHTAH
jgi:hypothetical protein